MMNDLYADMHAYWVNAGSPRKGLVFGPANTGVDSRKWKNHQRLARIAEPVSVHSCRKTTGSMLSDAGVPSRIIADILGQENPEVTDAHYIRTELDIRRKGIDKVGKLLTKATKQLEKKDAS
jgi:integrase